MGTNHLVDELYGISVDFKFYLTQLATSVVLLLLLRDGERSKFSRADVRAPPTPSQNSRNYFLYLLLFLVFPRILCS